MGVASGVWPPPSAPRSTSSLTGSSLTRDRPARSRPSCRAVTPWPAASSGPRPRCRCSDGRANARIGATGAWIEAVSDGVSRSDTAVFRSTSAVSSSSTVRCFATPQVNGRKRRGFLIVSPLRPLVRMASDHRAVPFRPVQVPARQLLAFAHVRLGLLPLTVIQPTSRSPRRPTGACCTPGPHRARSSAR